MIAKYNRAWTRVTLGICVLLSSLPVFAESRRVWLDEIPLQYMKQDFGSPQVNRSAGGTPLKLRQDTYARGIGTHANSIFLLDLKGGTTRFKALVGADNGSGGSVRFHVVADGAELFSSPVMNRDSFAVEVDVDLTGTRQIALMVDDGGDGIGGDHANWVNAHFLVSGAKPEPVAPERNPKQYGILTPSTPDAPRLTCARRFGVRPGSPIYFAVTATGKRPMKYAAVKLPSGVHLDEATGRLSGRIPEPGTHEISVTAANNAGSAEAKVQIVVGDSLALTPPMGWSSWNVWGGSVDQKKIQDAAETLIATGLDQRGFCFVNIDDFWQGERSGNSLALQANPMTFPDMPALAAFIHSRGLKMGLYSSPWKICYSGKPGSSADNANGTNNDSKREFGANSFVEQDAALWSSWGIDYLKYDWTPNDAARTQPMKRALNAQNRDIVLSLANSAPIWNADGFVREANSWRTNGDLVDSWDGILTSAFLVSPWKKYQSPGHWNDEDMLVIGTLGLGFFGETANRPCKLTPNEQYLHMTQWCMLSSPLMLSCDLSKLDPFTLNLITNDEVIAIDQDSLGQMAARVPFSPAAMALQQEKWVKPLSDGGLAVALYNLSSSAEQDIKIDWRDLNISGPHYVRDLWRQQDLGEFNDSFTYRVLIHGAAMLKLTPVTRAKKQ